VLKPIGGTKVKTGKSLVELATEVERQNEVKADYVVQSQALSVQTNEAGTQMALGSVVNGLTMMDQAHRQVATHLQIPQAYYDRLRSGHTQLLDTSINTLFQARETKERRMVRSLDGQARALLSDRYRRLDNYDLLEVLLPELADVPGLQLASCEVTDSRLYIQATTPRVQMDVKVGDTVQAGILITNSETGLGSLSVQPLSFRLVCTNGMVHNDFGQRRNHVGKAWEIWDSQAAEIFADDTLKAQDVAFYKTVRDTVRGSLSEAILGKIVAKMQEADTARIEGDPVKAVEVLAKKSTLNDKERAGVLRHLVEGGSLSMWGLANAVTRHSTEVESYDRAVELEALGGNIISLPRSEWREIATAS
jgi:hypothetical protein